MTSTLERESWVDAEPGRADYEREHMALVAPDLRWVEGLSTLGRSGLVGWEGPIPRWLGERPEPRGVAELVGARRFHIQVVYREAFPMVPPSIVPIDPEPPGWVRTHQQWHVMGDGSLCLFQSAMDWRPDMTAADLVIKASGWFIEFLLLQDERIDAMTVTGIRANDELDEIIASYA